MTRQKKILVIPQAGLGNRMRVLTSSIQMAQKYNRKLVVAWPVNSSLGCDMPDIFTSIGFQYETLPRWLNNLLTFTYRPGAVHKYAGIFRLFAKLFAYESLFDSDILDHNQKKVKYVDAHNTDKNLLVASCLAFDEHGEDDFSKYLKNENHRSLFQKFVFTEHLATWASVERAKLSNDYIAVHIRRTDHVDIIKNNPIHFYERELDKLLKENPECKIFLATDDLVTKNYLIERYGSSIHCLNHKLGRNDQESIHVAVVEMLLLAGARKIICSIQSSYSTAAILMGQIHEIIYVDAENH